ncbi:MAG: transglycosylase domain-containing protein, partial [Candidatus Heimdallarchaeota archaeon]|nr:transglycosylase domain-containing protein [Candidatus Heimdallarchaeota archaeon]
GPMPSFAELENPQSNLASEVISSDGELLGTFFIENRSNVDYRDICPNLINALIAIEDIRFEDHSGIDQRALLRVAFGVITGSSKGGGSTITQQLAKNLFPRGSLTTSQLVLRKFQEWITAVKLERTYSKQEIIAMYLNTVFYGHNSYGIQSAANTFFGKSPDSLNLQEAALMAGVVNRPSGYSPITYPEESMKRRNLVLNQMEKYGYINKETYDSVSQLPFGVSKYGVLDHNRGLATYFREYLRGQMKKWCKNHYKANGENFNLYTDGLKIYTTIDSRLQQYAEEAVFEHMSADLQPSFYRHWKGFTNAPFVFEDLEDEELKEAVDKIILQAVKRSERYRLLKKAGIESDSIEENFNTLVEIRIFSWDGPIDTIMTPLDSIRYYKY